MASLGASEYIVHPIFGGPCSLVCVLGSNADSRQMLAVFLLPMGRQKPEILTEGLYQEKEMCIDLSAVLFLFRAGGKHKFFVFGGNCAFLYYLGAGRSASFPWQVPTCIITVVNSVWKSVKEQSPQKPQPDF